MIPTVEIWKVFASLGVPGLALGILYLLFKRFQWKFPSLPQAWVGPLLLLFMLIVGGVVFYVLTLWRPGGSINSRSSDTSISSQKKPDIDLKLVLRVMGWRAYLANTGDDVARDISMYFVYWNPGSPGPQGEETYAVRNLIPSADDKVDLKFRNINVKLPTCGYFAVSSTGMARPKAWAFWIPNSQEDDERIRDLGWELDPWPIVSFLYPEEKPVWGALIDYPKGVDTVKGRVKYYHRWNPDTKRNEWRDDSTGSWKPVSNHAP